MSAIDPETLQQHRSYLVRYAILQLRDPHLAEDAVQAALIVAWRELRTLRDTDRFEPWLHRILTNECYAEARRRSAPVCECTQ